MRKRFFKPNMDFKISEDSAMEIFQKILDYYELDPEDLGDVKVQKVFESNFGRALKAIRLGRLKVEIGEKGIEISQTLKDKNDVLDYQIISGKHKTQMAGEKEDDHYGKIYALTGALTGVGKSGILLLEGVDLSLAEVLGAIFLSV